MKHIVIPDIQAKYVSEYGKRDKLVPMKHLMAAGQLIVDEKPDVVIVMGDVFDMPSLSSYDKGKKGFEGRRYKKDIEAGKIAISTLLAALRIHNRNMADLHRARYYPRLVFLLGNHEDRITRAIDSDAFLDGTISLDDLGLQEAGFEVHPFLDVVSIDGVNYSHFFPSTLSPHPIGRAHLIMNKRYQSCTCGHIQILDYFVSNTLVNKRRLHCLIAGSFYMHKEEYRKGQSNENWAGLIIKENVVNGEYSPTFLSITDLLARYPKHVEKK